MFSLKAYVMPLWGNISLSYHKGCVRNATTITIYVP